MRVVIAISLLTLAGCTRLGFTTVPDAEPPGDMGPDAAAVPGTWVELPPATFQMGSPADEPCRSSQDDEDLHPVTLTGGLELQATEVTQEQFRALMGYNPSHFSPCETCPVEMVTWHEATAYCNALSALKGLSPCYRCVGSGPTMTCDPVEAGPWIYSCAGYRLPTEAEWERACRGGTQTAFYSGSPDQTKCSECTALDANADSIAWYCANSGDATRPVGQKQANAHGLFDMAGNVWEWCHDPYQQHLGSSPVTDPAGSPAPKAVARGGAWLNNTRALRAAQRLVVDTVYRNNGVGFRCARSRD